MVARLKRCVLPQSADYRVGIKQVVTHGDQSRLRFVGNRLGLAWFLLEADDTPIGVDLDYPKLSCLFDSYRQCRNGYIGAFFLMLVNHLTDVHPVDMVCAENRHKSWSVSLDQIQVLINRVGGTLIPILAHAHLGRHRRDEVIPQKIGRSPPLFQMFQHRLGFELGQDVDRKDAGVYEIGKNKIDNSIAAPEGYSRFCPVCSQGIEPLAPPAREDNSQDIHHCTSLLPPQRRSCSYKLLYARAERSQEKSMPIALWINAVHDRLSTKTRNPLSM